jgi:hypothetical protein
VDSDQSPDIVPEPPVIAQRIFAAKDLFFKRTPYAKFTLDALSELLHHGNLGNPQWEGLPWSLSSIERARSDPETARFIPWPMTRWTTRPWLTNPELLTSSSSVPLKPDDQPCERIRVPLEGFDEEGNPIKVEAVAENGIIVKVVKLLPPSLAAVAASFATVLAADGMDGHFDHVIHWCRIVADLLPAVRL